MSDLGACFTQTHRFAEAEQMLNESFAVNANAVGENSPEYADTLALLAWLRREQGDLEAAFRLLQRDREIISKAAPDPFTLVAVQTRQCECLIEQGKFTEAETMLEPLKQDCHRLFGENENALYTNVRGLSEGLDFQRGDYARVASVGKEQLHRLAYLPKGEFGLVTANYMLGASLTKTGHAEEGEPYLRTALTDFNPARRALFLGYGNAETALGDCLLAQKRYVEAEPLLLTGHADLEKRLGPQNRQTIEATHRLHDLYLAWNKPAEAARFAGNATTRPSSSP